MDFILLVYGCHQKMKGRVDGGWKICFFSENELKTWKDEKEKRWTVIEQVRIFIISTHQFWNHGK